ncbi:MAG TPA: GNAT family N-acetyltransferase [Blastocatellia bacterium]|nr:GNAT family N-acetyltransferase [Blastocatellia bacterium]
MSDEWKWDDYLISTDRNLINIDLVHDFLTHSYWAEGIPMDVVKRSIENSLCFGIYKDKQQVGFARVITDLATYAYIGDVFVLESHRGRGLGVWLMETIMAHPQLQGLRRWSLLTRDAHWLYNRVGFTSIDAPERYMEKTVRGIYKKRDTHD